VNLLHLPILFVATTTTAACAKSHTPFGRASRPAGADKILKKLIYFRQPGKSSGRLGARYPGLFEAASPAAARPRKALSPAMMETVF
jgi:hypothetical protein